MRARQRAGLPDDELVALAQDEPLSEAGKHAASELLGRHQERVYAWCFRYVREHERALELAQDVLLRAYRSLGSFRRQARFTTWLYTITRNRCLSALKSPGLLVDVDAEPSELVDPGRSPAEEFEAREDAEQLREMLQQCLEPLEQEALWMRCFEKLPVDEITRVLKLDTASGARGLLQTARRKLRAALDKQEETDR